MGIRSFEKSGHMSKRTARMVYGSISVPPLAFLVWALVLNPKSWVIMVLIVVVIVSAVTGWFFQDGAYALGDDGKLIDRRPRTLGLEDQAMKAYEQNPNAENAERLRRAVGR